MIEYTEESIDLPGKVEEKKEEPKPQKPLKQVMKAWDENPKVKELGIMAVKKSSYRFLQISTIVFFVFIVFSFIGGLIIFNSKDFGTNVTVMNQMPEVPVSINNSYSNNFDNKIDNEYRNNYTININIDDDIAEMIADEVLDIIKNETD